MSVLRALFEEFDRIEVDTIEGPDAEVEENDTVVGIASDDVKRLYAMRNRFANEHNEVVKKQGSLALAHLGEEYPPDGWEELQTKHVTTGRRYDFVNDLMWTTIREQFPEITTKTEIGLRTDWQVVWIKPKPKTLLELLLSPLSE